MKGAMYCPLIFGADKTMMSVATGHIEYHPPYLLLGNVFNSVQQAHWNAVVPIGFLAISKCTSSPFQLVHGWLGNSSWLQIW